VINSVVMRSEVNFYFRAVQHTHGKQDPLIYAATSPPNYSHTYVP